MYGVKTNDLTLTGTQSNQYATHVLDFALGKAFCISNTVEFSL